MPSNGINSAISSGNNVLHANTIIMVTKSLLILSASKDISPFEIMNVTSQTVLYGIEPTKFVIQTKEELKRALYSGKQYDYIYLACHGCERSWGNASGSFEMSWIEFGAMICKSGVTKPGAVILHSCCRGGLHKVAYDMFACCENIEQVCGPRQSLTPEDLITSFNLFLYLIEQKRVHPVRAAEKVQSATDITLTCHDRADAIIDQNYIAHCRIIDKEVSKAFGGWSVDSDLSSTPDFSNPLQLIPPSEIPPEVLSMHYERFIQLALKCSKGDTFANYQYMKDLIEKEKSYDDSATLVQDLLFQEVQGHIVDALNNVLTFNLNNGDRAIFESYLELAGRANTTAQFIIICKDSVERLQLYKNKPV